MGDYILGFVAIILKICLRRQIFFAIIHCFCTAQTETPNMQQLLLGQCILLLAVFTILWFIGISMPLFVAVISGSLSAFVPATIFLLFGAWAARVGARSLTVVLSAEAVKWLCVALFVTTALLLGVEPIAFLLAFAITQCVHVISMIFLREKQHG